MSKNKRLIKKLFHRRVGIKLDTNKPFIILSYHPVTTEFEKTDSQTRMILDCINALEISTIILWPNADAGSSKIAKDNKNISRKWTIKKSSFLQKSSN